MCDPIISGVSPISAARQLPVLRPQARSLAVGAAAAMCRAVIRPTALSMVVVTKASSPESLATAIAANAVSGVPSRMGLITTTSAAEASMMALTAAAESMYSSAAMSTPRPLRLAIA